MTDPGERFWRRQARRLARRANLAFWFARWAPLAAAAAGVAAPLLLLARRSHRTSLAAAGLAGALLAVALAAAWLVRRRFLREADGLVWLEARLGLYSRLSAAAAGVGAWPDTARYAPAFRWRGLRAATPILFALGLLAAAALVPLSAPEAAPLAPPEAPAAWRQTEEWIRSLEEKKVAAPEALQPFSERLDQLRAQPQKSWYGESSLEASDTLRDQLRSEVRSLASDLDAAAGAFGTEQGMPAETAVDQRALRDALKGLSSRTLRLRPDLMKQMQGAAALQKMPALDASRLARTLREGAGFCRLSIRECRPGDTDCWRVVAGRTGNGNGGIDRGPGPAPLTLSAEASSLQTKRTEGVSNSDLSQAALGDVVGTSTGTHAVTARAGGLSAGGAAATGSGGEAVGNSQLTPEERRILARYFK